MRSATPDDVAVALRRSYLFEDLTDEQLAPLTLLATTRSLVRDEAVWRLGARADELFVVLSGEVKDSVVNEDGDEVVHFLHGPGHTFGEPGYFSVERTRIVQVIATAPTVLVRLHRDHLAPFMDQHVCLKDRALEMLASNTRWQTTMISSFATRPLVKRLVLRLLELAETNPEPVAGVASTPRISQSTLAAMIGGSRENVNRALGTLVGQGTVRRESGRYVLVDPAALRDEVARDFPMGRRRDRPVDPAG